MGEVSVLAPIPFTESLRGSFSMKTSEFSRLKTEIQADLTAVFCSVF